jgi:sugar lactone lactonase YvrE
VFPWGVSTDALGNVYVADSFNHRVRRIDSRGAINTIAGTGAIGNAGDGGVAVLAELNHPAGVAVDGLGNVLIADTVNNRVRRVGADGVISTVVGAEDIPQAQGIAIDGAGNLFLAATPGQVVVRIDPAGTLTIVAGQVGVSGYSGDGGPATSALLHDPTGIALDASGNLYIADRNNHRIRRVDTSNTISTVAGTGIREFGGDGGAATAADLNGPSGVAVDLDGNLYIADTGNNRIRKVVAGTITTIVGNGTYGGGSDGDAARSSDLPEATGVATDGQLVYISDGSGHRILGVDAGGLLHVIGGTSRRGSGGDGGPAVAATFWQPAGIAVDTFGNRYIADVQNCRIRRITSAGTISTVAGSGDCGFDGDDGMATDAKLAYPLDVAVDGSGNLYIADTGNNRIRKVTTGGTITTIAGGGPTFGDGGPAIDAQLGSPSGLAFSAGGDLYIADRDSQRIRRISGGTITTIAGDGTIGYGGDGDDATLAQLNFPFDVAVDGAGNVYLTDTYNNRIRKVDAAGDITTIAGDGTEGFDGDGGDAASAHLDRPVSITLDAGGNIIVADRDNRRVRKVSTTGEITTIAGMIDPEGTGPLARARLADPRALVRSPAFTLFAGGSSGVVHEIVAGGSSLSVVAGRYPQSTAIGARARYRDATFGSIEGIAYDAAAGIVYITDATSNRLHSIGLVDVANPSTWTISDLANVAGIAGFDNEPLATARFRTPTGLYLDPVSHRLYVADTGNHLVRAIDLSQGVGNATLETIAGVAQTRGYFGDGGAAPAALLYGPRAVTMCPNGDLFIADTGNHRARRIAAGGTTITTVLGDSVPASSGEGAPSSSFPVDAPHGLACDSLGNLFVTSTNTVRLLAANAAGVVDGSGAVETIYGASPRDTFPASVTRCLTGVLVVDDATLLVTDACTGIAVELRRQKDAP